MTNRQGEVPLTGRAKRLWNRWKDFPADLLFNEYEFAGRLSAIAKRYPPQCSSSTMRDIVLRAAAAGDDDAKRIIDEELLDRRCFIL